jgi:hypothetical protein
MSPPQRVPSARIRRALTRSGEAPGKGMRRIPPSSMRSKPSIVPAQTAPSGPSTTVWTMLWLSPSTVVHRRTAPLWNRNSPSFVATHKAPPRPAARPLTVPRPVRSMTANRSALRAEKCANPLCSMSTQRSPFRSTISEAIRRVAKGGCRGG